MIKNHKYSEIMWWKLAQFYIDGHLNDKNIFISYTKYVSKNIKLVLSKSNHKLLKQIYIKLYLVMSQYVILHTTFCKFNFIDVPLECIKKDCRRLKINPIFLNYGIFF